MANKITDAANKLKDAALDKNNASGALVGWLERFGDNIAGVAGKLFNGAKGAGDTAGGVVGWGPEKAGDMASRANKMTAGALNNKYIGGALMIAATVGIYNWAKAKLSNNRTQNDINIKNQQAAKIEAQTAGMVQDYQQSKAQSFQVGNNTRTREGTFVGDVAAQGQSQGVGARNF